MPQVELALAAVFGAELNVLLAPRVIHAQLVVGGRAQNVALVVLQSDVVGVLRVVDGVGDVGPVGVAVFEGNAHFGALDQRQVQAVSVPGVGARQAEPEALTAGRPSVSIEKEVAFVAAFLVDVGVQVVRFRTGDAGRDGAGDYWPGWYFRAEADGFGVGNRLELHFEAAITGSAGVQPDNDGAGGEVLRCALGFQYLSGHDGRAAGAAGQAGTGVEITLVGQACIEVAALAFQVLVLGVGIAQDAVRVAVVVGLAVGGGRRLEQIDAGVQLCCSIAVVVGAVVDLLLDHLVPELQVPDGVLPAGFQRRQRAKRQVRCDSVMALIIVELDDFDAQPRVHAEAVPDADLGSQALDEGQVVLAVLHHLFALRVLAGQFEEEVLPLEVVTPQHLLDDLRHALVLVEAKLARAIQQLQPRRERHFVTGFVPRDGQQTEMGNRAVQRAQRRRQGRRIAGNAELFRRRAQAEAGVPAQEAVCREVAIGAGEFDAVDERLAQRFVTAERQYIERYIKPLYAERMATVVEEGAQFIEHRSLPLLLGWRRRRRR